MSMISAITPAVNTGPVGRDEPAAAYRTDRLVQKSIRAMSTGDLIELVGRLDNGQGGYYDWALGVAAAELTERFGLEDEAELADAE